MEGMGMEGCTVTSLIVRKVELSLERDGNERGKGGSSVSNSTASLITLSEKKDNLRIGIHYLFLQRD